jgi:hypothetical protein
LGQQHGRPRVVRRGIVRHVSHVDAEADLRGKMKHSLDAAQRAIDRLGISDIRAYELSVEGICVAGRVNVAAQGIKDTHFMPSLKKFVQDMPADKPRATGEKYAHRGYRET